MRSFHVSLIQAINRRFETKNVGLVLLCENEIDYVLFSDKAAIHSADVFGSTSAIKTLADYESFFKTEIKGKFIPGFMPERNTPDFLKYLHNLTSEHALKVSFPMVNWVNYHATFEETFRNLIKEWIE